MQDSTALRVEARYFAKKLASNQLQKGDILTIWIKKGNWWTEIKRGVELEVLAVRGDTVTVNHHGWTTDGWDMKLPPGQDLSGKFTLEGNPMFRRALIVKRKP